MFVLTMAALVTSNSVVNKTPFVKKQWNAPLSLSSSQPCFFSDCPSAVEYIYSTMIKSDVDVKRVLFIIIEWLRDKSSFSGFSEEWHISFN